jgi:hypothetical protein
MSEGDDRRARRRGGRLRPALVALVLGAVTVAAAPAALPPAALAAPSTAAAPGAPGTVWLCRPGMADDPCTAPLTATVVPAHGRATVQHARPAEHPPIDCFYVYPTVSGQQTPLANLTVDPAETAVAKAQASRFSQACRVYAPMYPQITLYGLLHPGDLTAANLAEAYSGVRSAWNDYLAHYNHGRGFVLIGHSQGAAMLITLIRTAIDDDPAVRRHLVSAIILGGNVTVPVGKTVGGSFRHVPACRSATETGCVIAYSSFDTMPPTDTLFGKPGRGVSAMAGTTADAGLQVLCVNPASLSGGTGILDPYFPSASVTAGLGSEAAGAPRVSTPWVTEPDLYSGQCMYKDGISWLQVDDIAKPGDTRPVVTETLGPTWGLHLVDVNISLGNLVPLVEREAQAYAR